MFTIKGLNHVVLFVEDAQRSMAFYRDVLGFEPKEVNHPQRVFMRANGSHNHHDLGLFGMGPEATPLAEGLRIGMYHVAWELERIEDLAEVRGNLRNAGALVGETDHGNSLSVYAKDPDGNEFEVFWPIPRDEWEKRGQNNRMLDLEGEIERRGTAAATR